MNYTKQKLQDIMERNGGSLDLRGTSITALPEGLTVGGSLDLRGTSITALPEGLTVGGYLDLEGTSIKNANAKHLKDGDYVPEQYLYCDGILTHVKRSRKIGNYTFYVGKIKGRNVVSDGTLYAHCKTFKEGVLDLEFKKCKERGAEQYSALTLESELTFDEAVIAYRIITGACRAGTQAFLDTLKERKDKYTIAEIIKETRGQYGSATFEAFFNKE